LEPKGFRILEATINDGADPVDFAKKYGAKWPLGKADYKAAIEYLQLDPLKRNYVPYMLFIDRKGTIRAQYTGSDQAFFDESKQAGTIKAEALKYLSEAAATTAAPTGKK
jgi:hypothetical protein